MQRSNRVFPALVAVATLLAGCDSGDDTSSAGGGDAEPESDVVEYTVDASNSSVWVYVKLGETSASTVTSADAWDLAFKRYDVVLNGGVSGSRGVKGKLLHTPTGFYDGAGDPVPASFVSATAEDWLSLLEDAVAGDPAGLEVDAFVPAIPGLDGWYLYNGETHTLSAATDNWFLLRSAAKADTDGDAGTPTEYVYATLNPASLTGSSASRIVTFSVALSDDKGLSWDAPVTATFDFNGAGTPHEVCYSLRVPGNVACDTTAGWDLKMTKTAGTYAPVFALLVNGGASATGGGTARAIRMTDADTIAEADGGDIELGDNLETTGGMSFLWVADKNSSAIGGYGAENTWLEYGMGGDHLMYPNYRVYQVQTPEQDYAMQLVGYYDGSGVSGHISLRYRPVDAFIAP